MSAVSPAMPAALKGFKSVPILSFADAAAHCSKHFPHGEWTKAVIKAMSTGCERSLGSVSSDEVAVLNLYTQVGKGRREERRKNRMGERRIGREGDR